jgi:4-amino-4-deoxy-L-arabinose transferase-like glycosyltransferase
MVEFPLYQILGFFLHQSIPVLTIEISLRLISIFSSLLIIVFLFLLIHKYCGSLQALCVVFVFGFLPYSVYYSRAILPEMLSVSLAMGGIYFFDKFAEKDKSKILYFILSIIFSQCSLLVKPVSVFLLLPVLYLFWKFKGPRFLLSKEFYIYSVLSLVPFIAWRVWINKFPEGIPAYDWLLNGGNIRFTPAFFRWIIAERIGKLILGYTGMFFLLLGFTLQSDKKQNYIFSSLLIGSILYVFVFARGNVQHDYYQILLLPAISIYAGKGIEFLFSKVSGINRKIAFLVGIASVILMILLSWYEVRGYYWINHPEIIEAGKRVDLLTSKNSKVIAPYIGDTAFLYQTNRSGWPVVNKPISEMVRDGADYLVIVNPDQDALNLQTTYAVLEKKDSYIIYDLKKLP